MTLKYMQGFETMRDDTDFRLQGWLNAPVHMQSAFGPSFSGAGSTSLRMLGSANNGNNGPGTSGTQDLGYYNTGITVNQAWLAGGFAFGFGAKFNSNTTLSYGPGEAGNSNQCCFDGTNYWAIQYNGSSFNVAYSTNLQTWTVCAAQPTSLGVQSTISYMGGGVVMVVGGVTSATTQTLYYTSNLGASWSSQALGTVTSSPTTGVGIATGNSTYPHAVVMGSYLNGSYAYVYVGTLGGTMTSVGSMTTGNNVYNCNMRVREIGGLLVMCTVSVQFMTATASSSTLNSSSAWSSTTELYTASIGLSSDIAYNPTSNLWVVATSTGIWTFANSGSAGTPVAPSGTPTLTQRYSTAGMQNVWWTGSQLVAHGLQGHIISSPDGITWTESGGHLIVVGTSGTDWRNSIYDGSRYVLFSDAGNGVIATTPDLVTNYTTQYTQDPTEYDVGANTSSYTGLAGAESTPTSGGTWTNSANVCYLKVNAASGGARQVSLSFSAGNAVAPASISTSTLYHYYEVVATAATTANNFNISWYCDGSLQGTVTSQLCAVSTSDTTTLMVFMFNRGAVWTWYDDLYFNLVDGQGVSGQVGVCSIVGQRPTTDVQDVWVKTGSAASNSLSVNQSAYSSQSSNYVSSSNSGDKDIYSTSSTVPSGYTAKAMQVEAVFTKTSTTSPVVNVGISSGGTESDSANATLTTQNSPVYVAQVYDKNPNGSVAWTNTTVNAAEFVLNHVA
jgi:hypothetical protein